MIETAILCFGQNTEKAPKNRTEVYFYKFFGFKFSRAFLALSASRAVVSKHVGNKLKDSQAKYKIPIFLQLCLPLVYYAWLHDIFIQLNRKK